MNLEEIENRINSIIDEAYHRQIVFWYDAKEEYIELIKQLKVDNTEIMLSYIS